MGSAGQLDLDNIQGDILLDGLPKKTETFVFFSINDPTTFCQELRQVADEIAHTVHVADARSNIASNKGDGTVSTVGANIAFSFQGLKRVSPPPHSRLHRLD